MIADLGPSIFEWPLITSNKNASSISTKAY